MNDSISCTSIYRTVVWSHFLKITIHTFICRMTYFTLLSIVFVLFLSIISEYSCFIFMFVCYLKQNCFTKLFLINDISKKIFRRFLASLRMGLSLPRCHQKWLSPLRARPRSERENTVMFWSLVLKAVMPWLVVKERILEECFLLRNRSGLGSRVQLWLVSAPVPETFKRKRGGRKDELSP